MLTGTSLHAQFYFGRNKIQYEPFEWQVLETDHFDIYYYVDAEDIAAAAAVFAEQAFDDLELQFNHTVGDRIPLVIYSNHIHFQQTNVILSYIPEGVGGFFEFMKRRVVLPYLGSMDDFRHVVRHELVHVFMHHKVYSTVRHVRASDVPAIPLWFTEGLAELWSTNWDSRAELIIRDAVLNDYLLPMNSYGLLSSGYLLYKQGQAFLEYYQTQYGADRLRLLLETYWQHENFDDAVTAVSGRSFASIESDWRQYLKQRFAAALVDDQMLARDSGTLTDKGSNIFGVLHADSSGRHLHYITSRNGYLDIYLQDLATGEEKPLIRGERQAHRESLHFLRSTIHVNTHGQVAYVAKQGTRDVLRVFDPVAEKDIHTLQHPGLVTLTSPKWSPRGDQIVFSAQDYRGRVDVYLWTPGSTELIRLTGDVFEDRDPAFDPTGQHVVFSSDRGNTAIDNSRDLFMLVLKTGEIRQLTGDEHRNTSPLWTSVSTIHYLSDASGTANIWELELDPDSSGYRSLWHQPLTDMHTGFESLGAFTSDTLLTTAFQDYGFQVRVQPLDQLKESERTPVVIQSHPTPDWGIQGKDSASTRKRQPYKLDYSLDFAQAAVANDPIFGFQGGAQLGISDILGNRYFNFLVDNTAQTSSDFLSRFNVAITMVDLQRRANRAVSVFRFANEYFDPYQGFFFEEALGVRGALTYPINVFNRLEFSSSLWRSEKEYVFDQPREAILNSSFISFVHDNSLWTWTGPIDGWRMRVMVGPTFNFLNSRFHNYTALVDLRTYWRLNNAFTLAQRSMVWVNDGTDIRRFYIGGSWGLRGYRLQEVYGRQYIMFNQELRFPFAQDFSLRFQRFAVGLSPIRGAVFVDAGNAWDTEFPGLIGSFGVGLRGVLMGGLTLRLDIGRRTDFERLTSGVFYQFFFGWDF